MFKSFLLLLLLGHIIGDFYVQTEKMAEKKYDSTKWVVVHCAYYLFAVSLVSIPVLSLEILGINMVVAVLHMLIDLGKLYYIKQLSDTQKNKNDRSIYIVDQLLHITCLVVVAYYVTIHNGRLYEWHIFKQFMDVVGISEVVLVSWALAFLLLHKPANILIQKLLKLYRPQESGIEIRRDNNAGRFIGTVERIIMFIFISLEQYSAVGLVLTAKSIARYDRISKDKEFAEYYLLGTLISTLIVIVSFGVIQFLGVLH